MKKEKIHGRLLLWIGIHVAFLSVFLWVQKTSSAVNASPEPGFEKPVTGGRFSVEMGNPSQEKGRSFAVSVAAEPLPAQAQIEMRTSVLLKPSGQTADLPKLEDVIFKPAELLDKKVPHYPRIARRYGYEGEVLLGFEIDERGSVSGVEVIRSSGHKVLDRSATDALKEWRFAPARRLGSPVASRAEVPIFFRLAGKSGAAPGTE